MQNGKGSKPRSGYNDNYRRRFDEINWRKQKTIDKQGEKTVDITNEVRKE
jgi:hypothetical protein